MAQQHLGPQGSLPGSLQRNHRASLTGSPRGSERRATLLRELQQGEGLTSSAGEIARSTLVALEQQSESLRSTEDTLESNEYVIAY